MKITSLTCIKPFKDFTVGKKYRVNKEIPRNDGFCTSTLHVNDDNGHRHSFNIGVDNTRVSDVIENYFDFNTGRRNEKY